MFIKKALIKSEKDEKYVYFLKNWIVRRIERGGDIIMFEIPQIPKKLIVYRRPAYRNKSIDRIYLNHFDMSHIPLFECEENLKLLYLDNNHITKMENLISLNSLLYLNLYSNKITEISNLNSINRLKALMLGKNMIDKIQNLSCLPSLEVLDLHSNKIQKIENIEGLKKLKLLNLANNQITIFTEILFNKSLEEVNLRKNLVRLNYI
jgi:hypothetical protein